MAVPAKTHNRKDHETIGNAFEKSWLESEESPLIEEGQSTGSADNSANDNNSYNTLNVSAESLRSHDSTRAFLFCDKFRKFRCLTLMLLSFLLGAAIVVPILNRQLAETTNSNNPESDNRKNDESWNHLQGLFPATVYMTFQPKYDVVRICSDSLVLLVLIFVSLSVSLVVAMKPAPENTVSFGYCAPKCQAFWTAVLLMLLSSYTALWKIDSTPRRFDLVENPVPNTISERGQISPDERNQYSNNTEDERWKTNSTSFEASGEEDVLTTSAALSLVVPTVVGKTKVFYGITSAELISRPCPPSKYEKVTWYYYFSFTEAVRNKNEHWWEPRHSALVTVLRCDLFVPLTGLVWRRHEPCEVCINPVDPVRFLSAVQESLTIDEADER